MKKPIWKRWWFWVAAIVIIAVATTDDDTEQVADTSTTTSAAATAPAQTTEAPKKEEPEKEEAKPASFKVGDVVPVGQFEVKVESIQKGNQVGDEYLNKTAQGQFWMVKVSVKNVDKEARMIDTTMFKLLGNDGTSYEPDSEANIYANKDAKFFLQSVNPKLTANGIVVFDMPTDATNMKLEVLSGVGFKAGSSVTIDLGM